MTTVFQNPYSNIDMIDDSFWIHDPRYPLAPIVVKSFGTAIYMAMVHTLQQNRGVY